MRVGDDDAFGRHAGRCGNGCHERLALLVVEVDEIGLHAHVALDLSRGAIKYADMCIAIDDTCVLAHMAKVRTLKAMAVSALQKKGSSGSSASKTAAAVTPKQKGGGSATTPPKVKKVHADLRKQYKGRVVTLTNYAATLSAQLQKVEKDGKWGDDANKEFQSMERSTVLRYMLTSILALGLYCTRMLLRPIQEQKELATIPLPTDATVQSLAMASKETNGDLMKRLQRDVAEIGRAHV